MSWTKRRNTLEIYTKKIIEQRVVFNGSEK